MEQKMAKTVRPGEPDASSQTQHKPPGVAESGVMTGIAKSFAGAATGVIIGASVAGIPGAAFAGIAGFLIGFSSNEDDRRNKGW